ncbi:MAG: aspartate-semialdehyde dehydrogenase [Patescibacteria group bacterium]
MNIAIIGVTGLAGRELVKLLPNRNFQISNLKLFASERSAGTKIKFYSEELTVEAIRGNMFDGIDLAFFAVDSELAIKIMPWAGRAGTIVIDKSSAFRMERNVPLVIPEINPEALISHKGVIASPNCSTTIMLMGLWPLRQRYGLKRIIVSTYQAISGGGTTLLETFKDQIKDYACDIKKPDLLDQPHPSLFDAIPNIGGLYSNGISGEEGKMAEESRKILNMPDLLISATCVRIPVARGHSMAVNVEFESSEKVYLDSARMLIRNFGKGLRLIDCQNSYPMSCDTNTQEWCAVGRIREDPTVKNGLVLWISGDNLWKGAAFNAIQIAEELVSRGLIGV